MIFRPNFRKLNNLILVAKVTVAVFTFQPSSLIVSRADSTSDLLIFAFSPSIPSELCNSQAAVVSVL